MKHLFLALLLLSGIGMAQAEQMQLSVHKFQLTMAQRGSPEAAYTVAQMYEEGRGTERDLVKALEWYRRADATRHPDVTAKIAELEVRVAKPTASNL